MQLSIRHFFPKWRNTVLHLPAIDNLSETVSAVSEKQSRERWAGGAQVFRGQAYPVLLLRYALLQRWWHGPRASGEIRSAQWVQGSPELTPSSAAHSALTDCAGSMAKGAAASEQDLHLPPSTELGASQSQPWNGAIRISLYLSLQSMGNLVSLMTRQEKEELFPMESIRLVERDLASFSHCGEM